MLKQAFWQFAVQSNSKAKAPRSQCTPIMYLAQTSIARPRLPTCSRRSSRHRPPPFARTNSIRWTKWRKKCQHRSMKMNPRRSPTGTSRTRSDASDARRWGITTSPAPTAAAASTVSHPNTTPTDVLNVQSATSAISGGTSSVSVPLHLDTSARTARGGIPRLAVS